MGVSLPDRPSRKPNSARVNKAFVPTKLPIKFNLQDKCFDLLFRTPTRDSYCDLAFWICILCFIAKWERNAEVASKPLLCKVIISVSALWGPSRAWMHWS